MRMGARHYFATSDAATFGKLAGSFDLIINTVSAPMDWSQYLNLLRYDGTMVVVGVPDKAVELHAFSLIAGRRMRALYFTRATAPTGDGPRYHHIGLYAYRRAALERFVKLPPSPLEKQERLEQLRALEAGMRIDITLVDTVPRGVDTPADLETARRILAALAKA